MSLFSNNSGEQYPDNPKKEMKQLELAFPVILIGRFLERHCTFISSFLAQTETSNAIFEAYPCFERFFKAKSELLLKFIGHN